MRRLIVLVLLAGCWLPATAAWGTAASGTAAWGQAAWARGESDDGTGSGGEPGLWSWPLSGPRAVSRPFAPPASRYGSGHRGADLVSTPGAVVRAAGAGRISYAGLLAGRGVVVVVHGALRTTYEPVATTVGVGTEVVGGQPLGLLQPGHAGCPVTACLHWGLRRGEDYLDPVRLVRAGPVRLLPLSPAAGPVGPVGPVGPPLPRVALGPPATPAGPGAAVPSRVAAPAGALVLASAERDPTLPLATLALLALVVGVALLARPRRPPPGRPPPGPAAGPVGPRPAVADVDERPVLVPMGADLLELDVERLRRRA